ncbi:MAG: hypothetical protein Q7T05_02360 [Dehalococcoidia bacterium]|nr:hypothetical protein [Dehalococcoidia bacterium]
MLAQISLTPTESKKLISMAIVQMEVVKRAAREGIVVMHPSSSIYFIAEALAGRKPATDVWLCGAIVPKGACVEKSVFEGSHSVAHPGGYTPRAFGHSLVFEHGVLSQGEPLESLLERLKPTDVYIKGANALDVEGNVGVLIGSGAKGGTISRVVAARKQKEFNLIFPVGLEKLIPVTVKEASAAARGKFNDYSMGIACSMLPINFGTVVTELKAFSILSGVVATPIAAGGVGGAEGAITLVLEGDKEQMTKAISYAEQSKGAVLPQVRLHSCANCANHSCDFPMVGKPWA